MKKVCLIAALATCVLGAPGALSADGALSAGTGEGTSTPSTVVNASASSAVYQLDDGSGEQSLGCPICEPEYWLNAFQAVSGAEYITEAEIAFGANSNLDPPTDGTPVIVYLWEDPTNDGDPSDAVVVDSVNGTVQSVHTDTFITFEFPTGAQFEVDEWFFVGFASTGWAVASDVSSELAGRSWFSTSPDFAVDPNDLDAVGAAGFFGESSDLGFPANYLIRANGTSAVEPASPVPTLPLWGLLLLAGGAGLIGIRRFRKGA